MVTKKLSDGSGIYDEYFLGFGVGDADEREANLVRDVCFGFFFSQKEEQEEAHDNIHHNEHRAEFWRFHKKHDCVNNQPGAEK